MNVLSSSSIGPRSESEEQQEEEDGAYGVSAAAFFEADRYSAGFYSEDDDESITSTRNLYSSRSSLRSVMSAAELVEL